MESAPSPASEGKAMNLKQDKLLRINRQPCYRMGGQGMSNSVSSDSPCGEVGSTADYILQTDGLVREFAGFTAVNEVSLKIRRGHIHALIGPNGRQDNLFQSTDQVP